MNSAQDITSEVQQEKSVKIHKTLTQEELLKQFRHLASNRKVLMEGIMAVFSCIIKAKRDY